MTLASSTALGWLVWRREKNKKLLLLKIIAFVRRHVLFSPFESQLGEKVSNIISIVLYSKWKQPF